VTFDDAGAKDLSDFLVDHSAEELISRIGLELFPPSSQTLADVQQSCAEISPVA